jgi:hypothetical protein
MLKRWGRGAPLETKTPITSVVEAWVLPHFRIFSRMDNHVSWSEADPEDRSATRIGRLAPGPITVMVITHRTTGPCGASLQER